MLLPILVFIAVALGLLSAWFWLAPNRTQARLQEMLPSAKRQDWVATVADAVSPFARLSAPIGDWESSPLRLRFLHAGLRHPQARLIYFGCKTALPLAFAACAWLSVQSLGTLSGLGLLFVLSSAALLGCYLPDLALGQALRLRQREIFENFPDASDLMLVCVEAGMGLDAAMARVTEELRFKSRALAEELHLAGLELRAGASREQALRNLALRTGVEQIGTFATMLVQADRFGTSLGESLRVFADELRHKRQTRAEEAAAKIPTKLLLPLVVCIFPAVIMVILGPAVIRVIRVVIPMFAKGM
jgi:tight adherence protein C